MDRLDRGTLVAGFVIGLVVGGVLTLFKAPRSGQQVRQQITQAGEQVRNKLELAVPADPIAESIAEGKAAARRRRSELGLND
jgi:gas vesicle protein